MWAEERGSGPLPTGWRHGRSFHIPLLLINVLSNKVHVLALQPRAEAGFSSWKSPELPISGAHQQGGKGAGPSPRVTIFIARVGLPQCLRDLGCKRRETVGCRAASAPDKGFPPLPRHTPELRRPPCDVDKSQEKVDSSRA